jgi:hypothetical protein
MKVWKQQPTICRNHIWSGIQYPLLTSSLITGIQFSVSSRVSGSICDKPSILSETVGGAISGIITGLCLAPIDKYKIMSQFGKNEQIYRYGVISCLCREVPSGAIYFGSYHWMRQKDISIFLSGSFAGVLSWFITYPNDIIKTQIQSGYSQTMREAFGKIKSGQIRLGNGLGFCLMRAFIVNGIGFTVYEN